jgi:hypothetical protein
MILLIEAGGMRSAASLSSKTVPVSASIMKACLASVSIGAFAAPCGGGAAFSPWVDCLPLGRSLLYLGGVGRAERDGVKAGGKQDH